MAIEYANSDPIKVTHTKGAMSDGQKYTNTLPWKVELTNDDLAYQEDIQNLQRQINALEADLTWRDPVETYEDLPASGNDDGDVRLVTSTGVLYVWAGSEWVALNESQDPIKELTEADYVSGSNYVALWKLSTGWYHIGSGIGYKTDNSSSREVNDSLFLICRASGGNILIFTYNWFNYGAWGYPAGYTVVNNTGGAYGSGYFLSNQNVQDSLTSTETKKPLSAKQGKVLNEKIGDLTTLETTDKTSTVNAINELLGNVGKAKELTTADYNYDYGNTGANNCVALWLLEPGIYYAKNRGQAGQILIRWSRTGHTPSNETLYNFFMIWNYDATKKVVAAFANDTWNAMNVGGILFSVRTTDGYGFSSTRLLSESSVKNTLDSTSTAFPLSANQGKILNERIGDLTTLTTTDKTSAVAAINEIAANAGGITELTADDYDYPTTGTADGVAAWLLDPGVYTAATGVKVYVNTTTASSDAQTLIVSETTSNNIKPIVRIYEYGTYSYVQICGTLPASGQGSTNDLLASRNIKQSTGTSQTDVMSQNATSKMVWDDPANRTVIKMSVVGDSAGQYSTSVGRGSLASGNYGVAIGGNSSYSVNSGTKAKGSNSVAIGVNAQAYNPNDVAIGSNTTTNGAVDGGIAIGEQAVCQATSGTAIGRSTWTSASAAASVALGAFSKTTRQGEVNVGVVGQSWGYNNSHYRVIGGVHDGVDAHDAATYGQLSTAILNGGTTAPTTATVGAVGTLYSYVDITGTTPVPHLMVCTVADTVTPEYTWVETGGGGGQTVVPLSDNELNNLWNGESS